MKAKIDIKEKMLCARFYIESDTKSNPKFSEFEQFGIDCNVSSISFRIDVCYKDGSVSSTKDWCPVRGYFGDVIFPYDSYDHKGRYTISLVGKCYNEEEFEECLSEIDYVDVYFKTQDGGDVLAFHCTMDDAKRTKNGGHQKETLKLMKRLDDAINRLNEHRGLPYSTTYSSGAYANWDRARKISEIEYQLTQPVPSATDKQISYASKLAKSCKGWESVDFSKLNRYQVSLFIELASYIPTSYNACLDNEKLFDEYNKFLKDKRYI